MPTEREFTTQRGEGSGSVQECVEGETGEAMSSSSPQSLVIHVPLAVLEQNALKVLVGGKQEHVVRKEEVQAKEVSEESSTAAEERTEQDSTGLSIPPGVPVCLSPLVEESDAIDSTSTTVDVQAMKNAELDSPLENNAITLKDMQGTVPGAPILVDLQSPEKYDSPITSPMTGHSSSLTLSPHSLNGDEMMLRLEASLSSAPETDSDQELGSVEEDQETGVMEVMSCGDDNAHVEAEEKGEGGLPFESKMTQFKEEATSQSPSPAHSEPTTTQILGSSAVSTGAEEMGNEPLTFPTAIVTSSAEHRASRDRSPSVESGEIQSDDETARKSADEDTAAVDNKVHHSSKDTPTSTLPLSVCSSPETVASECPSSDPPPPPPPPPARKPHLPHRTPPWAVLKPSQQTISTKPEKSNPKENSKAKTHPRRLNPLSVMSILSVDKGPPSPPPADPDSTTVSKEAPDKEDCAVVSSSRDSPDEEEGETEVNVPTSTGNIQDSEVVSAPLKTEAPPSPSQSHGEFQQEPKFTPILREKSSSSEKELPPSTREDHLLLSAINRDFMSAPIMSAPEKEKSGFHHSRKFPSESDGKSSEESPLPLSKSASYDDIMPLFPKQMHQKSKSPSTDTSDLVEKRQPHAFHDHSWRAGIDNNPWHSFSDDDRLPREDACHKHLPSLMQMTSNSARGHLRHRQPHHYRPQSHPYNLRLGNTERSQSYSPSFLPLPPPRFIQSLSPFPPDPTPPLIATPPQIPSYIFPAGRPPPGGHFPPPYFANRNHYTLPYRQGPYF